MAAVLLIFAGALVFASCGGGAEQPAVNAPDVATVETAGPVGVTVSKNGFEPKTIDVKKGQRVRLEFTRTDEENCGSEIVFPKQEIKKTLPLNEPVPVELTAEEAGEIGFTCGMDMLRGKIVVQ